MILNAVVKGGGGGGGADINAVAASSLPSAVVDGQAIIITDTTPGKIMFSYATPSDPVSGDIWVHTVDNGGYTLSSDGAVGIRITPGAVMQFNGSIWEYRNAYIGVNGEWKLFSTLSPLSSLTWAQIVAIANSGEDASTFFAVGDEHILTLTTGEIVTVLIGDFNHNTITGTNQTAALAFTFKDCLNTVYAINTSGTNTGGWPACSLRNSIMPTILNAFPADCLAGIKYVDVLSGPGGMSNALLPPVTSSDRLRLHSVIELGKTASYVTTGEGTAYACYSSNASRKKKVNGAFSGYWTRSAKKINGYSSDGKGFANCANDGTINSADAYASNAFGVACCFDI